MNPQLTILVINGPNLNMLGIRQPEVYGRTTLNDIEQMLEEKAKECGVILRFFQSNSEGALVSAIQDAYGTIDGIIINPGAYTHYSYAIRDAISAVAIHTIEVHISNIYKREEFRHHSVLAPVCQGQISGFGIAGYVYALEAMIRLLSDIPS